jgi:hypothetical protein
MKDFVFERKRGGSGTTLRATPFSAWPPTGRRMSERIVRRSVIVAAFISTLLGFVGTASASCQSDCQSTLTSCHGGCGTRQDCHNDCDTAYQSCLASCPAGTPTQARPTPTPGATPTATPTALDLSQKVLNNGTLAVTFDPQWGGIIRYLKYNNGPNWVNNGRPTTGPVAKQGDPGRQIQAALFLPPNPGPADPWVCPYRTYNWLNPFNPTQGGSPCSRAADANAGSEVTNMTLTSTTMYTRTKARHFNPAYPGGEVSKAVIEQWSSFEPGMPNVMRLDFTATNNDVEGITGDQQVPCMFLEFDQFQTAYTYTGASPWTYDALEEVPAQNFPNETRRVSGEDWGAWINQNTGVGLGLYVPREGNRPYHFNFMYDAVAQGSTKYVLLDNWIQQTSPSIPTILPNGGALSQRAYLVAGTLGEIRARVYQLSGHGNVTPRPTPLSRSTPRALPTETGAPRPTSTPRPTPTATATHVPTLPPTPTVTPTPTPAAGAQFYTVPPCRIVETRNPNGPYGGPALSGGDTRSFLLTGRCGIPATARAVAVTMVAVAPTGGGYLTLFPESVPLPSNVSTINYAAGQTRSNNAIVLPTLRVHCGQAPGTSVHFVLDVTGYFQ